MRGDPPTASLQLHLQRLGRRLDLAQSAMASALGALVNVLRRVGAGAS